VMGGAVVVVVVTRVTGGRLTVLEVPGPAVVLAGAVVVGVGLPVVLGPGREVGVVAWGLDVVVAATCASAGRNPQAAVAPPTARARANRLLVAAPTGRPAGDGARRLGVTSPAWPTDSVVPGADG
jgi:hypothetical protein